MTTTITTPEAGRLYLCDQLPNGEWDSRILVTSVRVYPTCWAVEGYRVTRGYALTSEPVRKEGHIGTPHGVRYDAFCTVTGDVPYGESSPQRPLFSARFPASDHSRVASVEAQGRARYMA